jgi:electron transport complex protein RnfG
LVATLALAGALAGLLLVFVDQATRPRIEENRRRALREAVDEVLGGPARVVSFRLANGHLLRDPETRYQVDTERLDRVFAGYSDAAGKHLVGFAVAYQRTGFQDAIRLIFGFDPRTREVLGVRVLESKETPGLGDRVEGAAFLDPMRGKKLALVGVKAGAGSADEARRVHEVDTITGATISSSAVIRIIDEAAAKAQPAIDLWLAEGGR